MIHNTKISIIAAIGAKKELGYDNQMIWGISDDLKRFKRLTMGHPIIMGRKTFESIGRVLPGRTNMIVTRDSNYRVEGAVICSSIEQAIDRAKEIEQTRLRQGSGGRGEIFIMGGSQIFEQMIDRADKLYLTKINSEAPLADVFFPDYSDFEKVVFSEKHNDDGLEYEFIDLERGA